ncbi:hypothetical protein D3C76_1303870 [compost metagenome]
MAGTYAGSARHSSAWARATSPWRSRKSIDSGNWRTSSGNISKGTTATKNTACQPQVGISSIPRPAESMPPTE